MSRSTVEQVIGKLVMDRDFRASVAADAGSALAGYDLSSEERQAFNALDIAEFEADVRGLDERLSKGFRYVA